eukprot:scaffold5837_cov67-Phaeocystis_antarctica.AAC.1
MEAFILGEKVIHPEDSRRARARLSAASAAVRRAAASGQWRALGRRSARSWAHTYPRAGRATYLVVPKIEGPRR